MKASRVPGKGNYAFVTYEDHAGAVAAIEGMNNKEFQGQCVTVEKSRKFTFI